MNALNDAKIAISTLKTCESKDFGRIFTDLRIRFWRNYAKNRIFSTSHGADFFENVVGCVNGKEWKGQGEYEINFKKMIDEIRADVVG